MFKKTLLALAVTGVSLSANAATIKTGVTAVATDAGTAVTYLNNKAAVPGTPVAGEALGVDKAFNTGSDDNCADIAKQLGATFDANGKKSAAAGAGADKAAVPTFVLGLATPSVVQMTADNVCSVTINQTTTTTANKDGIEYSSLTAIEIKPVIVAGIGGYKVEDTITLNITGAKINTALSTAPTMTVDAGGKVGTPTFDILDIAENQIRFTIKGNPAADSVKGNAIVKFAGIKLDSTGLSSSTSVTVDSFATNTSGTKFDVSKAETITSLVPQYTTEVDTALNEAIDVSKDRQQFANGTTDVLQLKTTKNTTGLELTPETGVYKVVGDFSWFKGPTIDADKDGKLTSAEIGKAVAYTDAGNAGDTLKSFAVNSTFTELTVTTTVAGTLDASPRITFTVPGYDQGKGVNPMIPVQSFTVKADSVSTKVGTKTATMPGLDTSAAGAWTLNGSVIVVPYVPFGPATQPILRHTNAGSQSGDITVRYMVEGVHTAWQPLAAAGIKNATPGVRDMLGLVTDALKGEGYDSTTKGFKVALEVVTNVPSKDVHVYGGAKITAEGQDRIHLGTFRTNTQ